MAPFTISRAAQALILAIARGRTAGQARLRRMGSCSRASVRVHQTALRFSNRPDKLASPLRPLLELFVPSNRPVRTATTSARTPELFSRGSEQISCALAIMPIIPPSARL